jgi:hypothetical protein
MGNCDRHLLLIRLAVLLIPAALLFAGCQTPDPTVATLPKRLSENWPDADKLYTGRVYSKAARRVKKQLQKPISVNFDETPLKAVIARLRDKTGLNYYLNWTALDDAGVKPDQPITVKLRQSPTHHVIDVVLAEAAVKAIGELAMRIDDDVVEISSEYDFEHNAQKRVRFYPLQHILLALTRPKAMTPRSDPRKRASVSSSATQPATRPSPGLMIIDDDEPTPLEIARSQIREYLTEYAGQAYRWGPGAPNRLIFVGSNLLVAAPAATQQQVAERLRQLHRAVTDQLAQRISHTNVMHLLREADRQRLAGDYRDAMQTTLEAGRIDPHHVSAQAMYQVLRRTLKNQSQSEREERPATRPASTDAKK